MPRTANTKSLTRVILNDWGRTYADELGINLRENTPSVLFRWLCAATLFSARISADLARDAATALAKQGWTTANKMAHSTWSQRTRVLNRSGYARYDERTSRMLGDAAELLQHEYRGDLRRLRDAANGEPRELRKRLKTFKGMGDVGVDIFFREVQEPWDELYPFADRKAISAARRLGLGGNAEELSGHVRKRDFPRLVAGLVRLDLAKAYDSVRNAAG